MRGRAWTPLQPAPPPPHTHTHTPSISHNNDELMMHNRQCSKHGEEYQATLLAPAGRLVSAGTAWALLAHTARALLAHSLACATCAATRGAQRTCEQPAQCPLQRQVQRSAERAQRQRMMMQLHKSRICIGFRVLGVKMGGGKPSARHQSMHCDCCSHNRAENAA
jgi:hypothetical protein